MVNDIIGAILEDFEKESADLWYMVDPVDYLSFTDTSEECDKLIDYLWEKNFEALAIMDDPDGSIYVVLSSHNPTNLCSIDVVTDNEHWYKIFGDLRDCTNYNYLYHNDRENLYRAFADMCIWMDAAKNNEHEYRANHCKNLGYKLIC